MTHLRTSRDLALVCGLTALDAAVVLANVGPTWLRAVLGVPVVVVFLGYSLTVAVFPTRALSPLDRTLYSTGASLALTALAGLALDATPSGLVSRAWALTVLGIVLVFAAVGFVRRARGASPEPHHGSPTVAAVISFTRVWGIPGLIAAVLLIGALAFDRYDARAVQRDTDVSALWLLPGPGPSALRVGIVREGSTAGHFDLVVRHGSRVILRVSSIALSPGHSWSRPIAVSGALRSQVTSATLYQHGSQQQLRFARLAKLGVAAPAAHHRKHHEALSQKRADRARRGRTR